MKVFPDKLGDQLGKRLSPVYIVSGDEPLLHMEACDAIRAAVRERGFDEREVLHVEANFNWSQLSETASNLSLFASRRLLELRLGGQSPGQDGAKALEAYAANAKHSDDVLLISAARFDYRTQQSKWFKALDAVGVFVPVWPVEYKRLHFWVRDRAARHQLELDTQASQALAERFEGNLLALDQTLAKLRLLHPAGARLDLESIEQSSGDGARFDVFNLTDACVQGERERALRIVQGLRAEGVEAPVVLWALTRELRTLLSLRQHLDQGQSFDHACKAQKPSIMEKRRPGYQAATKRLPHARLCKLLLFAQRIDLSVKGAAPLPTWAALSDLALTLAGGRGPLCEWAGAYRIQPG